MALNPNVVVVAPGDLITSAHLNNIRSNLDRLDTTKVGTTGNWTMTGNLGAQGNVTGGTMVTVGVNRAGGNPVGGTPVVGAQLDPAGQVAAFAGTDIPSLWIDRAGPGAVAASKMATFRRNQVEIGSISIATNTSTAYNTTSDPRLKHRDGAVVDALGRARRVGAAVFTGRWIDFDDDPDGHPAGDPWDLVNAPDVADVAAYAVTGEPDAVDADGNPEYQQVNYPALVPLLFAALDALAARIDDLEADLP